MMQLPFQDREQAAHALAAALARYRGMHPVVLGIPRGAMPMARIVADALDADLDMILVRKLGAPGNPEHAIGAVDERGSVLLNEASVWSGAGRAYLQAEIDQQLALMRERRARYGGDALGDLTGRTVIVLDDGLATGATMVAALRAVRAQSPARLVCAVPVAAADSLADVRQVADDVVYLATPYPFRAVSLYYRNFAEVTDDDVAAALQGRRKAASRGIASQPVRIPAGQWLLEGALRVPEHAIGLVVFAHGSGSSHLSPRNRHVADALAQKGIASLLFDLLTPREDVTPSVRFDIAILASRLESAVAWVRRQPHCLGLPLGLFGASTGAAAALRVAAAHPDLIAGVVSRGGRPDLAGRDILQRVRTPVLLIVGAADPDVLELNRSARGVMGARAELVTIPGAGHLFEEPGTLEAMTVVAADWFARELGAHGERRLQHHQ